MYNVSVASFEPGDRGQGPGKPRWTSSAASSDALGDVGVGRRAHHGTHRHSHPDVLRESRASGGPPGPLRGRRSPGSHDLDASSPGRDPLSAPRTLWRVAAVLAERTHCTHVNALTLPTHQLEHTGHVRHTQETFRTKRPETPQITGNRGPRDDEGHGRSRIMLMLSLYQGYPLVYDSESTSKGHSSLSILLFESSH